MNRLFGYLIGLLFLALMAPGAAWAATYAVDTTVDNGALSACTAAAGDCSLRGAVNAVNAGAGGDIISLPAGTYTLTGANGDDANLSGDLDISKVVTIQGAGAATTIIDGNGATTGDRVIHVTAAVALTVDGVTITGGSTAANGGGISSLGAVSIINSTISGNTAGGSGGVLSRSALMVTNSTISNNKATTGGVGGISANGTLAVTVTNSTISGNTAALFCGGIYSFGAVTVTNSTISGNTAGGDLGGIYARGALTVANSTISGNSARGGGGGFSGSVLTVNNSTISGNSATTGNAGGISANAGGTITNSTISGNSAVSWGGAIDNQTAPLSITNSTIVGNSSGNGALFAFLAGANITLSNTIIAGNTGGNCAFAGGAFISSGYNIDSDGLCNLVAATDISNSATIAGSLGVLANNGGSTKTHALLAGSPAIDAGSCVNAADQRGISRPRDGNADKLAQCDIGAYEYGVNASSILNMTVLGSGSVSDGITGINAANTMNPCAAGTCVESYSSTATISLTATPGAGQTFLGWIGGPCDGTTTNPCSVLMSSNQNITALFATDGLIVTVVGPGAVTSDVGGIDCPSVLCAAAY
ncbi:MAG: right-handed parallel beta-helix repeat-containing protein, partial [Nitrospinota bacterium]|nr:right-handed parallel beta-helix repeat-containing protein [Nitrospinota bacterium]